MIDAMVTNPSARISLLEENCRMREPLLLRSMKVILFLMVDLFESRVVGYRRPARAVMPITFFSHISENYYIYRLSVKECRSALAATMLWAYLA